MRTLAAVRTFIHWRVAAWQAEGDTDPPSTLRHDAFLHLRTQLENGRELDNDGCLYRSA